MIAPVRRDLPSGTVTFLFTDVEGSTRLLHELGAEGYSAALLEHRLILRETFAGHGGQVLLSKEARDAANVDAIDLGEHRLKDFDEAFSIFQLGSKRFPPLKTISNTNLPRPASSFFGRDREVKEVVSLL